MQWHEKFDCIILEYSFKYNNADRCIYPKFTNDFNVIIWFYVDDILIISANMNYVNDTKKYITSWFKMKDLNRVDIILGINVRKHNGRFYYLSIIILRKSSINLIIWISK
jgi:hypothetical protein